MTRKYWGRYVKYLRVKTNISHNDIFMEYFNNLMFINSFITDKFI